MSFGGFLDSNGPGGGGGGGGGDIPFSNNNNIRSENNNMGFGGKSIFSSPGLSLALQTAGMEGQGEVLPRISETFEVNGSNGRRSRDEEHDSRSGSDNLEGGSGDDLDTTDRPPRKKRYHRHTPQQIQELESLFKECPHPDEKQRLELSRRLSLETRQVKFWFQNRRTQMKTQIERHENSILRQENDRLRAENMTIREAMRSPSCNNCGGGAAMIGDVSLEEQHLRLENARMKEELDRVCALAGKFLGRPVSSIPGSLIPQQQQQPMLNSGFNNLNPDFGINRVSAAAVAAAVATAQHQQQQQQTTGIERSLERSMYLELALVAMDELVKMAQTDEPLWFKSLEDSGRDVLNEDEYFRSFNPCIGLKPNGFVTEASRETGLVIINSLALVETLMDSNRWADMFSCMIARAATTDVISSGMGGTRNGSLQLMHAELQVLSPLVPIREVNFLRFCKQHAENIWAVVDVSIDTIRDSSGSTFASCRRLPSGCLVQDMPNGYSKVTWIEHAEFDISVIHQIYRPLICAGMGFGAHKWMATLQRQSECLAMLMSTSMPTRDHTSAITASGRRSMLKLAQRMTANFCAGTCGSTVHKWNKIPANNVDEDVRVMTRNSMDDPGEPPGIVLSASTSVWLPVSPTRLFDFLRDERLRSEWDILSNGGPMQEMAHIAKGQDPGNCVSLLRVSAMNSEQSSMLILQETCVDAVGSLVVYAPVDIPAMHVVMKGGDSAYVALLPSGFSILADGSSGSRSRRQVNGGGDDGGGGTVNGSLLTVVFQILVNNLPNGKLTMESVETVNNLISCTVQRIKAALHCEN